MKRNMLLTALGLSLLFNVFVLIGFMQGRFQAESPSTPAVQPSEQAKSDDKLTSEVTNDLKLDTEQSKLFAELRQSMRNQATLFDESAALIQQSIVTEMKKDSPDPDKLRELLETRADLDRQRRVARAEHFEEFVRTLNPTQRKQMLRRLGGGWGGPPPPPGDPQHEHVGPQLPPIMLERFDRNHNGQLEPDEMEAAQREITARQQAIRRMRPPGPEMMRRFDTNHDGRLDEQERAAMERYRREHPGQLGSERGQESERGPGRRPPDRNGRPIQFPDDDSGPPLDFDPLPPE